MPLQDLDKIVLHQTVVGIECPACGGELEAAPGTTRQYIRALWRRICCRLPPYPVRKYQCHTCRRAYGLAEMSE